MAKWLDKYEQGGMVLKQKTKDNYGKKPNPNNVETSVGPNFVGQGYDITGRNYSPAWGGQFQNGGEFNTTINNTNNDFYSGGQKVTFTDDPKYQNVIGTPNTDNFNTNITSSNVQNHQPTEDKNQTITNTYSKSVNNSKFPKDKKSQGFYNMMDEYYNANGRTDEEKAQYAAFQKFNETHGYAPVGLRGGYRSMINPFTGRLNLGTGDGEITPKDLMEEYISEYGHYQQYNKNPEESGIRKTTRFLGNMTKDWGNTLKNLHGLNFVDAYDKNYNTPGTTEHEAHNINESNIKKELANYYDEEMTRKKDKLQMGGALPGATGMMYARTQNPAPSNGKYAKKTKASAQDGKVLTGSDPTKKKIYGAPEEDKINDWYKQYYGSDFFKQNLADASKNIVNVDPNEVSKAAINAINNTQVIYSKTPEQMTYSFPGKIIMGNPNVYGNQPRNETYAHEVGHTYGLDLLANQPKNLFFMDNHAIGKKEYADKLYKDLTAPIENSYSYGPEFKSEEEKRKRVLSNYVQKEEDLGMVNHGKAQTEQRADIMALRYLAAKKGIWDASKSKPGSFTPEMLNKLYKTKEVNTPVTRYSDLGGGKTTDEIDPNDIKQGNLKNVAPPKTPGTILPELRRKFSDKDILYLMNKLAKNEGNVSVDQAQNGGEMNFYQQGLDFTPKTISKNGSVIKDDMGQWAHPGEITEINSNDITMEGVDYPVLGVSDTGDTKLMQPDQNYKFKGKKVTEYPMAKNGGWLNKYK